MADVKTMPGHNVPAEVSREVAHLKAGALSLIFGLIGGVGLFLMTIWLLIKGGPHVGSHLQLLGQYFIGYSVSWRGSLVGFCYGAATCGLVGWTIGTVYNRVIVIQHRQPHSP